MKEIEKIEIYKQKFRLKKTQGRKKKWKKKSIKNWNNERNEESMID